MTQQEFEKLLQKKCPWHPGANHAAIECYHLRRTFRNPCGGKKNKKPIEKEQEAPGQEKRGFYRLLGAGHGDGEVASRSGGGGPVK
jgi:hypothetical protein